MKSKLLTTFSFLTLTWVGEAFGAKAEITRVHMERGLPGFRASDKILRVDTLSCGVFSGIATELVNVGTNAVEIQIKLEPDECENPQSQSFFITNLTQKLESLSLNPESTKVLVQIQ